MTVLVTDEISGEEAQWLALQSANREVGGSSLRGGGAVVSAAEC